MLLNHFKKRIMVTVSGLSATEDIVFTSTLGYTGYWKGDLSLTQNNALFTDFNSGYTGTSRLGSMYTIGVAIGTGTTPPTLDDYTLAEPIENNLKLKSTGVSYSLPTDDKPVLVATQTVTNISTENVTITEVGLFGLYQLGNATHGITLYTRTLLDTPVTITPGETKSITVSINYNKFFEETTVA